MPYHDLTAADKKFHLRFIELNPTSLSLQASSILTDSRVLSYKLVNILLHTLYIRPHAKHFF